SHPASFPLPEPFCSGRVEKHAHARLRDENYAYPRPAALPPARGGSRSEDDSTLVMHFCYHEDANISIYASGEQRHTSAEPAGHDRHKWACAPTQRPQRGAYV